MMSDPLALQVIYLAVMDFVAHWRQARPARKAHPAVRSGHSMMYDPMMTQVVNMAVFMADDGDEEHAEPDKMSDEAPARKGWFSGRWHLFRFAKRKRHALRLLFRW